MGQLRGAGHAARLGAVPGELNIAEDHEIVAALRPLLDDEFVLEPEGDVHVLHRGETLGWIRGDGAVVEVALSIWYEQAPDDSRSDWQLASELFDDLFDVWRQHGWKVVDSPQRVDANLYRAEVVRSVSDCNAAAAALRWAAEQERDVEIEDGE